MPMNDLSRFPHLVDIQTPADLRRLPEEALPGVMAADRAEMWGASKFRYWLTGHIHNQQIKEFAGCTVESFNTLAPNDAYAANGGWRSRQNMKAIILHKEFGEVARHTVCPQMLQEAA